MRNRKIQFEDLMDKYKNALMVASKEADNIAEFYNRKGAEKFNPEFFEQFFEMHDKMDDVIKMIKKVRYWAPYEKKDNLDESVTLWLQRYAGILTEGDRNERFSIYKPLPAEPGKTVTNKVKVKTFKTKDDMYTFLGKQTNNDWKETDVSGLKSGTYKLNMVRGKDGKPSREFIKV